MMLINCPFLLACGMLPLSEILYDIINRYIMQHSDWLMTIPYNSMLRNGSKKKAYWTIARNQPITGHFACHFRFWSVRKDVV